MSRSNHTCGLKPQTRQQQIRNDYLEALKSTLSDEERNVATTDMLDLLKVQRQLADTLSALQSTSVQDQASNTSVQAACDTMQAGLTTFQAFFNSTLGFDPLKTEPSDTSAAKAEELFGVPELMEMILLKLDLPDIFRAMPASKTFKSAVDTSPKLQMKLGLRADPHARGWSNFETTKSFANGSWHLTYPMSKLLSVEVRRTNDVESERKIAISAKFPNYNRVHGRPFPSIGARCRSMLICQPPVTEVRMYLNCCSAYDVDDTSSKPGVLRLVSNENGVTLGDLMDATVVYEARHTLCAHATRDMHDIRSGFVMVEAVFYGEVELAADHRGQTVKLESPRSPPPEVRRPTWRDFRRFPTRAEENLFDEYFYYKGCASRLCQGIMTLDEFKGRMEDPANANSARLLRRRILELYGLYPLRRTR